MRVPNILHLVGVQKYPKPTLMLKNIVVGERGIRTVIMSTHNLDHGLALATRVAVLSKGSIAYDEQQSDISKDEFKEIYASFAGVGN